MHAHPQSTPASGKKKTGSAMCLVLRMSRNLCTALAHITIIIGTHTYIHAHVLDDDEAHEPSVNGHRGSITGTYGGRRFLIERPRGISHHHTPYL